MACVLCKVGLYMRNLLVLADEAGNTIALGGSPHETISSEMGRVEEAEQAAIKAGKKAPRWAIVFCRVLGWVFRDPNHCIDSILPDDDCDQVVKL